MTVAQLVDARPEAVNLVMYAGNDFRIEVTVTNPDGTDADLAGADVRADIRATTDTAVIASFTAGVAGNVIELWLPAADTAVLPGSAVWDCLVADVDTVTVAAGTIRTQARVTV